MNLKTIHWVMVAASTLAAAATAAGQADPMLAPYAHGLLGVCAALTTVLGLMSPSVFTPPAPESK